MIQLLLPKKLLLFAAFVQFIVSAFFPLRADAGIFSFFGRLLSGDPEKETKIIFDSRTMPLLDAPTNENLRVGQGGGSINIVQNSALLPVTGPLGSIADVEEFPTNDRISIYVVREGDNLSQIAQMFRVSVNTIAWANGIGRGDLIQAGQVLVILPVSGVQYTVKNGDTMQSIARRFNGDAGDIIRYNGLSETGPLAVGVEIIIPNGESASVPAPRSVSLSRAQARGAGGPNYTGYYIRPISSGRRSQGLHGYNGVDLADSCGTPVVAAATGDVIISRILGWNGGYGAYVAIDHANGTQTLYAHLGSVIVGSGWHVVQGQMIGSVGTTGNSTGCHLHFEVRGARNPFIAQ